MGLAVFLVVVTFGFWAPTWRLKFGVSVGVVALRVSDKNHATFTHFTMKILRTYIYINCSRKICLLKNLSAYCVYPPASPIFLLFCEHKHYDNAATNSNSEKATSRIMASVIGRVDTGQKKISLELDAFGLMDSTMLRSVLSWRAF